MSLTAWLKRRVRILFRRHDVESDLSDEIRLHLDMETAELARQGRTGAEAEREARLLLGGVEQTKEAVRDLRPLRWLDGIGLDLRLGLRMLRKSWGLTLVGGLAMVIVIGLCTTGFVILKAVTGMELPLEEGERVVELRARDRVTLDMATAVRHFERWRASMRSVQDLAAFQIVWRDLITPDTATGRVSVARMAAAGFRVTRVQPLLGRFLLEEDEREGAQPVAVIGYDVWQSRFASDPAAVGQTVRLGGLEHVVVGVMPKDFKFPVNQGAWTPWRADLLHAPDQRVRVFGRLAPGIALENAAAELATVGAEPVDASGDTPQQLRTGLTPYGIAFQDPKPDWWVFRAVYLMFALLLIPPCANIAILIYARNVTRTQEFAARYVLGAGRRRIVGQLLLEAWVLAACAGGVALAGTQWFLDWIRRYAERDPELSNGFSYWFWTNFRLSFESILYVAGLTFFAALIAGGLPALRATGRIAQAGFQGLGSRMGGPRLGRTWTALVAIQVALSMAVLPVAASQVWANLKPAILGPGFPAGEYLTAQLAMDEERSSARLGDLQEEMVRRLKTKSGLLGVTLSSAIPGVEPVSMVEASLAGQERFFSRWNVVDDAFFRVFPAPLLTGRGFEPTDFTPGRPVAVVTRAFAEKLADGVNPLGLRVRPIAARGAEPSPWFEIVGVVDDLSKSDVLPTIYRAMQPTQDRNSASLAVRVGSTIPPGLAARLPQIATALDPGLRVDVLRPLDGVYQDAYRDENIVTLALAVVVVIVLLFSVAGIYTLAAFAVAQRRREIAIRAAVGAHPWRLVTDIFGRTLLPVIAGAGVGALVALYIDANVENDLSAISLWASAVLFLIAIALLAVAGPARRVLRVDATEALRES